MTRPMGRRPKPTELKLLEGNPGHRKQRADVPTAAKPSRIPPTPPGLEAPGRAAWTLYWTEGAAWLAKVDVPIVHRLCKLHDLTAATERVVRDESLMHENERTGRSALHHLVNTLLGLYGRMDAMGSLLGFDPANRSRIKVDRLPADALGEWERSG